MAAVTDSDDTSDIFWPGYVDAVTNLAINLLFVIAIMAIVVMAANMQIGELQRGKDRVLGGGQVPVTAENTKEKVALTNAQTELMKSLNQLRELHEGKNIPGTPIALRDQKAEAAVGAKQLEIALHELQTVLTKSEGKSGLAKEGDAKSGLAKEGKAKSGLDRSTIALEALFQALTALKPLQTQLQEKSDNYKSEFTPTASSVKKLEVALQSLQTALQQQVQVQEDHLTNDPIGGKNRTRTMQGSEKADQAKHSNVMSAQDQLDVSQQAIVQAMSSLKSLQIQMQGVQEGKNNFGAQAAQTVKQLETELQAVQSSLAKQVQEHKNLNAKLQQLQRQLEQTQAKQAAVKSKDAPSELTGGNKNAQSPQEILIQERVLAEAKGESKLHTLNNGSGFVVVFANDVIQLSEKESTDLLRKITTFDSQSTRWELRVLSPKGFSEATRIAYYRLNNLRNVLLKNGTPAANIDMRVIETESAQANNTRVLIKPIP